MSMIPQAALCSHCCPSGIYESTCTIPFALVLTKTNVWTSAMVSWCSLRAGNFLVFLIPKPVHHRQLRSLFRLLFGLRLTPWVSSVLESLAICTGLSYFRRRILPSQTCQWNIFQENRWALNSWRSRTRRVRRFLRCVHEALLCSRFPLIRSLCLAVADFCWRRLSSFSQVRTCSQTAGSARWLCRRHYLQNAYATKSAK